MIKIVHNNKIDKSPHKTYSKTIIDSESGCKNLIQSILYLKDNSVIFNKTQKSQKIAYILNLETRDLIKSKKEMKKIFKLQR